MPIPLQLPPSKLPHIGTTIFTEMSALSQAHGSLNMSQGFPDFNPPEALRQAVFDAMNAGENQYAPMAGNPELRHWIAQDLRRRTGYTYDVDSEITVGAGASSLLFAAIQAFVNPGDEVIILAPAYDLYEPAVALAGGQVRVVALHAENFHIDLDALESAITPVTRMIVLNTPNNPTGSCWDMSTLNALYDVVKNTAILLLSDEVYGPLQHDGRTALSLAHHPGLAARGMVAASFGKILHATGWKIGFIAGPYSLMAEIRKVHQYDVFSTGAPLQAGIVNFLKSDAGKNHLAELPGFYEAKRDRLLAGLSGSLWQFKPAEGGYFQVLDYGAFESRADYEVAHAWAKAGPEFGIALIPMSPFYPHLKQPALDSKRLRICFAKTDSTIDDAVQRLLHWSNRAST